MFIGLLSVSSCRLLVRQNSTLPDQRQSEARIQRIANLSLQWQGRVRAGRVFLNRQVAGAQTWKIHYRLQAPLSKTADNNIRGFLDGDAKYLMNQGTAYHNRVGRRNESAFHREYELFRTLLRWELPVWPPDARVVAARIRLSVEPAYVPALDGPTPLRPLHVFAHPLTSDWEPGFGGVDKDSFSEAAPGESDWNFARKGARRWEVPGALAREHGVTIGDSKAPLAAALIPGFDQRIELEGSELGSYVQSCARENRSVDLLLKLDDIEEDLPGTITSFSADNFGDDWDIDSRRPRLDVDIQINRAGSLSEESFSLEQGIGRVFARREHPGEEVLLFAEIPPEPGQVPPGAFVRGGKAGESSDSRPWQRLDNPLVKRWDWSQIMLAAPVRRVVAGRPFVVDILATWVKPGPRELQTPELALVSPSGKIHRVRGKPAPEFHYTMEFLPDEPGVWRYGWAFRPEAAPCPPEFHHGEGVFFADLLPMPYTAADFEKLAAELTASFTTHSKQTPSDILRFNAFERCAVSFSNRGPQERELAQRLLKQVRDVLPVAPDAFLDLSPERIR